MFHLSQAAAATLPPQSYLIFWAMPPPQRNNQITSIKHVVFPSGLTMLGLVSFPDLTLIFWVAMTHLLFVYSCHGVVFKIFVTLLTRTGI